MKDVNPRAQGRLRRRQGRGRAGREPQGLAPPSISSAATSSTSPSRKSPRAARSTRIDGLSYRNAAGVDRPQSRARHPRGHGPAAVRHRGLQARPQDRGLFHRLSEASLRLALHRARLQVALHLLPVAADRGRPPLPRAQRRPRDRGDPPRQALFPAGEGVLLRRRHLHRQSAARRGDRARARQARRHLVVQRQGQRAARDAQGADATTGCACCWSATNPATSRSCTTSRRAC